MRATFAIILLAAAALVGGAACEPADEPRTEPDPGRVGPPAGTGWEEPIDPLDPDTVPEPVDPDIPQDTV